MGMELQADKNTCGRYGSLTTTVVGTGTRLEKHKYAQAGKRKVNNIAADDKSPFRNGNIMQTDWMKDRWENTYNLLLVSYT